jgi:hypothetical protein
VSADDRSSSGGNCGREADRLPSDAHFLSDGHEPDHERLRALSTEINHRFSPRLDHTVLVLYDLDPEYLQVQWSILPEDFSSACGAFPGGPADLRQVLRLCRLDGEGRAEEVHRDVTAASASTLQGHRVLAPEQLGAEYECELGLESGDGGWLMLVRSNRARLAGQNLMDPGDPGETDQVHTRAAERKGFADSDNSGDRQVELALAEDSAPLHPVFPSPGSADNTPAVWLSLASARLGDDSLGARDRGPVAPANVGDTSDSKRGTVPSAPPAYDSVAMPPPLLPSTQYLAQSEPDAALPRYDPRAALSSAALRGSVGKLAELDMQAELVVHGCARPGAPIDLFGLNIRAGEDGLFSVRCPVTDPKILSLALCGHAAARSGDTEPEKH